MVLEMLYKSSMSVKFYLNEVKMCVKVLRGFFEELDKREEEVKDFLNLYFLVVILRDLKDI